MEEIKSIYVTGHKEYSLPNISSIYIPMMVGNKYETIPDGYISDRTGDNISDKNDFYNELTAFYWIWKNDCSDIVGLCHYRRFFVKPIGKAKNLLFGKTTDFIDEEYITKKLMHYDIIVHNKTYFMESNRSQLTSKNAEGRESNNKLEVRDWDLAEKVFMEVHPEDYPIYQKVMNGRSAHLLNMMIMRKPLFDRYCEWLFPYLFRYEAELKRVQPNESLSRKVGLLAERLLDIWIKKENLRRKECLSVNTERKDWKMW